MHPVRRESASTAQAAQRPAALKNRAYSAPMVHAGLRRDDAHAQDSLDAPAEDEEIADDPFFQRYNFPTSSAMPITGALPQIASHEPSSPESNSDTEFGPLATVPNTRLPGVAEEAGLPSPRSPLIPFGSGFDVSSTMQDINIAVLGARGTGKSGFVQRALARPVNSAITTHMMKIDEGCYIVRFMEINITDIIIGERSSIKWPETIDNYATPRVDGAVVVYDITNEESLTLVPELLSVLAVNSLPAVLVACKCDQHPAHRAVDPATVEQKARSFLGELHTFQCSAGDPEVDKTCLGVITRAIIAAKRPRSQASSMARPRASSSAVGQGGRKEQWGKGRHERANSEFSLATNRPRSSQSRGHSYRSSETPGHTFLDLEESPGYDSYESDGPPSDDGQSIISTLPSDENGYTFNQLVDRLLAQPLSKNDTKFVSIFLALYRKFATPGQLLEAISKRFDVLKEDKNPQVIRLIAQLRYLSVLSQWISYYPGDFAYPTSRRNVRKFVLGLAGNREFAVAAKEMMHDLEAVCEDDDTDWACSDRQRDGDHLPSFHNILDEDSEDDEFTRALGDLAVTGDRLSFAQSMRTSASQTTQSTNSSMDSSSQTLLHQVERNEKLAKLLVPNPVKSLSKIQWHQLMGESDEAIARELTRMDWIMFSSIRPRDLVRHVSLNAEEKKKCKSLENVNRMIDHFNHVAYSVTNYILLRDKPKHRALMLEKWMRIARALRQLNNYNGLGAVLAGIKGTAVHRLVATRDLVPQNSARDFMKLEILMGTQKSHFAYRLAWDNSSGERVPYLPLHRRDLVSASEGNSTFMGDKKPAPAFTPHPGVSVFQSAAGNRDSREAPPGGVQGKERINWKKFEIMGEVIVGVLRAQGTPYPSIPKNDEVRNLILDVKIVKDDDELYDRSVQLEAAGAGERNRRIINWFRER